MKKHITLFNTSDNEEDNRRNAICQFILFGFTPSDLTDPLRWANETYEQEEVWQAITYLNSLPRKDVENYIGYVKAKIRGESE